ncbi:polyprenyl synthetase family protein [Streptomyces spiramyceticus]|uniref:polyprenyl synthetase family protein n=1 Tax=Streptomyces spiramyceticus TaxID=299717 RepID=UPI00237B5B8F|nr:polyprenyl synthetase family protein [Streptomyces spiramyceticus]
MAALPLQFPPPGSADDIDLASLRQAVGVALREFLHSKNRTADNPRLSPLIEVLQDFVAAGGKRVRPLLCCCGWYAAAGSGAFAPVFQVAVALELFHTFALIHDDMMDASETRRSRPSVHRALAAGFEGHRDAHTAELLGRHSAILLGDLALVWSDHLLQTSALTAVQRAAVLPLLDAMRTEVMLGQYLDLCHAGRAGGDVESALQIARFKTAKYTVERPLQIGAALAGASPDTLAACTAYALPIGEAYQLRDDLLGVFGDPALTGKSALEDLRAGKHTALLAIALRNADAFEAAVLRRLVGDPTLDENGAAAVRGVLTATGAREEVEAMIRSRRRQALGALDRSPFQPAARTALRALARTTTERTA